MIAKDDFDYFCENNNIRMFTSLHDVTNKHIWTLQFPNGEEIVYDIPRMGNVDELYKFRENLHRKVKLKMLQMKIWKLTQKNK